MVFSSIIVQTIYQTKHINRIPKVLITVSNIDKLQAFLCFIKLLVIRF